MNYKTINNQKIKYPHLLVFIRQSNRQQEVDSSIDILLFLLRYSFLLTDKPQENIFFKRDFPPPGELFSQNSNGARYLDPKYSRWISVDPALGEYVPAAGKSNEADNLPGMGGIFNSVNLSLYHYAGNNPVKYTDPDGKQTLPSQTPNFRSMMNEYSKECEAIGGAVEMTFNERNASGLAAIIDKVFLDEKYLKRCMEYERKILVQFMLVQVETKASGVFDYNKDGKYDERETKAFANYVNNTMLLNYGDQSNLGPYKGSVTIPQLKEYQADLFLNKSIKLNSDEIELFLKRKNQKEKMED